MLLLFPTEGNLIKLSVNPNNRLFCFHSCCQDCKTREIIMQIQTEAAMLFIWSNQLFTSWEMSGPCLTVVCFTASVLVFGRVAKRNRNRV